MVVIFVEMFFFGFGGRIGFGGGFGGMRRWVG